MGRYSRKKKEGRRSTERRTDKNCLSGRIADRQNSGLNFGKVPSSRFQSLVKPGPLFYPEIPSNMPVSV